MRGRGRSPGNFGAESAPVGQQRFSGSTSDFIVPAGVSSVCIGAVEIGSTGDTDGSTYGQGGQGGDAAYRNNVPVTPGSTIRVTNPSASPIVYYPIGTIIVRPAAAGVAGQTRYIGGPGRYREGASANTRRAGGGNAATFSANGPTTTGVGTGDGYDPETNALGNYGGGGNSDGLFDPQPGTVLIRWGAGAQFPGAR